ncbi:MAG TPA: mechanosensitive ion channel family protein [Polyangiaceae bacterium]|nr:mechanosensitive ion channel family protein [Polyangiaceae bacterium]
MHEILESLATASATSLGLSVAIFLVAAIALLAPPSERKLLRQPIGFIVLFLVTRLLELVLSEASTAKRVVSIVGLTAILIAIGRGTVLLVVDIALGRRFSRPLPKIIRDIIQGIVYFVLSLAILRQLGFEPGQLLTTSALLTAVIGLSLQDTLGNVIAGLAVQIQRPFDVGDWVQYDDNPKNIGRVIESNWRATTLLTLDEFEIVVPNSMLAKAPLKNFTKPTNVARRNVYVSAAYDVPPRKVHKTILQAITDAPGVLKKPAPTVVTNNFGDSAIEYWVRFYTDQFHRRDIVESGVRDRIWYAFQRAGITVPFPHRVVHMQEASEAALERAARAKIEAGEKALSNVDFLQVISDDQRRTLAERAHTRMFSTGETVVRQGDTTTELYLVLRGEVVVVLESETVETEVTRLGVGAYFGEMALITGEPRRATVKVSRDSELLVIDHAAFESVLRETPEVVEALSQVLAERQVELDVHSVRGSSEERTSVVDQQSGVLLGRIKRLFKL